VATLFTFGHGTLDEDDFVALVEEAGIAEIVDVRAFPGSRRNPQFGTDAMAVWLPASGIAYSWMRDLGGRRKPVAGSKHVALRNDAFRAYADHMETPAFVAAIDQLLQEPARAVLCSETVWWRCHRRLISDHVTLVRGVEVRHLMHDGRLTLHVPTDGVRLDGDRLVYDVGATPPLLDT
jgi:uncharacterized protein (DUF488 family)